MAAVMDLDPIFVKALKLMHSRSKDALEQLKQMTDEAIAQRRGELALKRMEEDGRKGDDIKYSYKSGIKREHSEVDKKRDTDKKSLERLKEDLASLNDDAPSPLKKPKLDSPSSDSKHSSWKDRDRERSRDSSKDSGSERSTSHRDSKRDDRERDRDRDRDRDGQKPTLKEDPSWLDSGTTKSKKVEDPKQDKMPSALILGGNKAGSDSSEDNDDNSSFPGLDAEQFATDMMDLACVVCKQFDITSGNRLLDCQECHRLYHQECHKPPVDEDVDDPRFVWYCSKCSKNMKKMVKAQKPKSGQNSSSKEKDNSGAPQKTLLPTLQQPFKRLDPSKSSGNSKESSSSLTSSSSRPYTGLASLAANLSSKTHGESSSKSSRSVESSSKSSSGSSSKNDSSKGLGFLFKPDAHKITTLSSQKSTDGKSGLSKLSSASGKSSTSSSTARSSSTSSSSSTKPSGIAVLAKSSNTSSMSKSSSSSSLQKVASSSGSGNSTTKMSHSSLMSADKKVQMMKKKAAARAVEKKLR